MNKKITHILSLTILLLTCIGFGIGKTQNTTVENNNTNDSYNQSSRELASLYSVDSSSVTKSNTSEIDDINTELLAIENEVEVLEENAQTSYYHDKFVGRKTASGEVYDNKDYTAAHRTLPFGSKLRVTNNANEESVIVTVNDRGPFTRGRKLDLSKQAFLDITHNRNSGTLSVKIEVLPDDYEESKLEIQEDLNEFML